MFKPTYVLRKTCSRNQENSFISNKKFIQVISSNCKEDRALRMNPERILIIYKSLSLYILHLHKELLNPQKEASLQKS